jgi:hypothetical protein
MFSTVDRRSPTSSGAACVRRLAIATLPVLVGLAAGCGDLPTEAMEEGGASFTPTAPHDCESAGDIALGQTRSGRIEQGDCSSYEGGRFDRWTLTLDSDADVRIDLTSRAFDTVLELLDASGYGIANAPASRVPPRWRREADAAGPGRDEHVVEADAGRARRDEMRSAASSGMRSASPFARAVTSSAHSSPSFLSRRFSSVSSLTV